MPNYRRLKEQSSERIKDYSEGWQWKELSSSFVPSWVNWLYPLAVLGLVLGLAVAFIQNDQPVKSAGQGSAVPEAPAEENVAVADAAGGPATGVPAEAVRVIRAGVQSLFSGDATGMPLAPGAVVPTPVRQFANPQVVSEAAVSIGTSAVVMSVTVAPGGQGSPEALQSVAGRAEVIDGTWRFVP